MRKPYYFVPICPECASKSTGRFVREQKMYKTYTMYESLKNGEIIKFKDDIPVKNLFCAECGATWSGDAVLRFLTPDEIEDEAEARGTPAMLEEYIETHHIDMHPKKSFFGGIFSGITNF